MVEAAKTHRIQDLNTSERPRERLEKYGAQVLTNGELLAILLRVGIQGRNAVQLGQEILTRFGDLAGIQRAPFSALCEIEGVGPAKAAQIKAAIELGNRLSKESTNEKPLVSKPEDAIELVRYELRGKEQEELWVMMLSSRNRMLQIDKLYKGSLNSSSVRIAELFKTAIRINAAAVILFHNHPSGDAKESSEDVNLTKTALEAGKMLDIKVLDHIIIAGGDFVSIKKQHPGLWLD